MALGSALLLRRLQSPRPHRPKRRARSPREHRAAMSLLGTAQELHLPGECDPTPTTVLAQDLRGIRKRGLARPIALPFAAQGEPCYGNGPCLDHSPNRHVVSFRGYAA